MMENSITASSHAVVFDLDGTLVDTLPDLHHAINRVLEEEGLKTLAKEETRLMIGGGARNLIQLAFAKRELNADTDRIDAGFDRFLKYYGAEPTAQSRTFPGVLNVLENLSEKGIAMGVCTNKPQEMAEQVLKGLEISHFFGEAVIGGDTLLIRKPDADHLLAVIKKTGRLPKNAVMVGDSETDVSAARNAGIPIIVVDFGYTAVPPEKLKGDVLISHFDELIPALASIGLGT